MIHQDSQQRPLSVLAVHGSGRRQGSISRMLIADVLAALERREGQVAVTHRDLAAGVPLVDAAWIAASFTADDQRSAAQREKLAVSDALVRELEAADVVVIGAPIYNFGVPAALKAWIDMIARPRKTFRYSAKGSVGLLEGKKAYVVIASGGVPVDSAVDFATPYLRHALGFVGIDDVEVIAAERLNRNADDAIDAARARIAELIHTTRSLDDRAA